MGEKSKRGLEMTAADESPKARLHIACDLAAGAVVSPAPEQVQYLGAVLRLKAGDRIALFNGRDGEWGAQIRELRKARAVLEVTDLRRPQGTETGPWVAFAPIKKSRLDFLIEKCVELGAERLLPVITERTVVARVNAERLRAQAVEAAEQSERLTVPEVADPVDLGEFLSQFPADRTLIAGDERGDGTPLPQAIANLPPGRPACLLTGPEGGFTPREFDMLSGRPFVCRVGLGPRILRAETAAVVALSCWQMLAGDGNTRPRAGA